MLAKTEKLDHATVAALREMRGAGSPGFLGELIDLFLGTFSAQLDALLRHDEQADLDGLRRTSHDLKSSSASVGAVVLAGYCADLGALARSGATSGASVLVRHIFEEFTAVRPELEALLPVAR